MSNEMDDNKSTKVANVHELDTAAYKRRIDVEDQVANAAAKRRRCDPYLNTHLEKQFQGRRLATMPPIRVHHTYTKQAARATSGSTAIMSGDPALSSSDYEVITLPGAQQADVAVLLRNNLIVRVNARNLKLGSSWFYDKLIVAVAESNLPDVPFLADVIACFTLATAGKPVLDRVSKYEMMGSLSTRKALKDVKAETSASSDSVTIKADPDMLQEGSNSNIPDSNLDTDAHISLRSLIHDQNPPTTSGGFAYTFEVVKRVISLARHYDCVEVLRPRLAACLHQGRQDLFIAVKDNPPRFAIIASVLEDQSIMTEAMIHMVGCSPVWPLSWTDQSVLEKREECQGVLATVQRKAGELLRQCEKLDRQILMNSLQNQNAQRLDLSKNAQSWVVTQLVRDWFAHAMDDIGSHVAFEDHPGDMLEQPNPLLVGGVYRKLLEGGDAYLPIQEVFKSLNKLMIGYEHTEVAEDLGLMKNWMKEVVEDICQNRLMLDEKTNGIGHLTCVEVTEQNMPWIANGPTF